MGVVSSITSLIRVICSTVYLKFAVFMLWEVSWLRCDFGTVHFVRLFCVGCYKIEERSMFLSRHIATTVTHLFQTGVWWWLLISNLRICELHLCVTCNRNLDLVHAFLAFYVARAMSSTFYLQASSLKFNSENE